MDLFGAGREIEPLHVPDAEISILRSADLGAPNSAIFDVLLEQTPWRAETVTVWGKSHLQPRLIAWYGDPDRTYTYSGIVLEPLPWTPVIGMIRAKAEDLAKTNFNSVLLNLYRNERDSMGFHSDDESELGPEPVIASVSLGATRTFVMKHRTRKDLKTVKIELTDGSVLLMQGSTQRNWKHGIEKESKRCGPRINLTFRQVISSRLPVRRPPKGGGVR